MWVRSPCSTVMALGAQDTNSGDSQSCCAVPLLHEAQKGSKQPFVTCCPPPEPWPHCSLCSINPVTGRVEEKLPNPMEGMTEEQKEHEAMKLVNMFDKLSRYWDTWCVPGVHLSQTFLWLRSQGLKGSRRGSGRGYVGNLFPQHDVQGKRCQPLQLWQDGTPWNSSLCPRCSQAPAARQLCAGAWEGQQPLSWQCCSGGSSILGTNRGTDGSPCHQPLSLLECFLQSPLTQRSPAEFRLSRGGGK